jgi:hypothetical protein
MNHHTMKYVSAIVGLSFLVCVPGLKSVFGKDAPTSAPQLLQKLNAGLKAKDKVAILALFNWEGVGTATESFYNGAISDLLEEDVNNVKLAPLPKGFRTIYGRETAFAFLPMSLSSASWM